VVRADRVAAAKDSEAEHELKVHSSKGGPRQ
jgi:hypothetical protein